MVPVRKTLTFMVLGLVLAGCGGNGKEAATATGPSCAAVAEEARLANAAALQDFQARLDATRGRAALLADFSSVQASAEAQLDQVPLNCKAAGACATSVDAWVSVEKARIAQIASALSGAGSGVDPGEAPPVDC